MFIERLSVLEEINDIQERYYCDKGYKPYNLSKWTTSETFADEMLKSFKPINTANPIDYVYNYTMDSQINRSVMSKLGVDDWNSLIITPNNTASILLVAIFLKMYQYANVCILNPAYFSIAKAMDCVGVHFENVNLLYQMGKHLIPMEEIIHKNYDVIWITSPIFCTGEYFGEQEIAKIVDLLQMGKLVITDESFCINGFELSRVIGSDKNLISIYSPHKSISYNGYKFSAVICNQEYHRFFDHWVDVVTGNLQTSNHNAILHFLSPNYSECVQIFRNFTDNARQRVLELTDKYINVAICSESIGSLMTIIIKNLPFDVGNDINFIRKMIYETGVSFYPGCLSGFNDQYNFCFRLNLCLFDQYYCSSLKKALDYLATI